jgi:nitrite reductase/ring-hydroxylating ferredoxin subunit/DMSO/TMAO reductase YedYZ heme-binding membrane subunit
VSVKYVGVQWTRAKIVYDVVVVASVAAFIQVFERVGAATLHGDRYLSPPVLEMRAFGTCAFLMISAILSIGPLARLDKRFAPLLYNRRHLGVVTCGVALAHAYHVLGFYYAYSSDRPITLALANDRAFTSATLPFPLFGLAALVIFVVMAVTSHDFWQRFLGPQAWKWLHMSVYAAYALIVLHVAFGAAQLDMHPALVALFALSVVVVVGLHLVAAQRSTALDRHPTPPAKDDGTWLDAGPVRALKPNRVLPVIGKTGERIAVVRHAGGISAVHGVCAHQGGPLSEGKLIDGCLTCPWHGWQYRPEDGCAPPPFVEKIPTYRVKIADGRILVSTQAEPAGTKLPPAVVETEPADAPKSEPVDA